MIKFTNASEAFKGDAIYINPSHVTAVYEFAKNKGGSLTTIIYGGHTGITWEVEESLGQVIKMLEQI